MRFTRTFFATSSALTVIALSACGGGSSTASSDVGAPSDVESVDSAKWFTDNCMAAAPYKNSKSTSLAFTTVAIPANPELGTGSDDKPRVYTYDEANDTATASHVLDEPVCWNASTSEEVATEDPDGHSLTIMKVSTPHGEVWVDDNKAADGYYVLDESDGQFCKPSIGGGSVDESFRLATDYVNVDDAKTSAEEKDFCDLVSCGG